MRKGKPAKKLDPVVQSRAVPPAKSFVEVGDHLLVLPSPPETRRLAAVQRVASRFTQWRPARQVLTRVRAVPTIFPSLDMASRVGGFPVGRVSVVHGPSSEGKSLIALGLGLSFLKRGHFFGYVDAEFSTPIGWLEGLMEHEADNPLFMGLRPKSYEQTVDAVREMLKVIILAKTSGEIPDAAGIIVVDSLRALVPEDFIAKIQRFGAQGDKGSVDGMSGMGAAIKAKMNAEWFDELRPMLYQADVGMLIVGRESTRRNAPKGAPDWQLTGGRAVVFETSGLLMRCERDWLREGSGPDSVVVGERHDVGIYKSKVAGKDEIVSEWSFCTSNGKVVPEGFDQGRDLLELGVTLGVVKVAGTSNYSFASARWQGKHKAVVRLHEDPELRGRLEQACRARFKTIETEAIGPVALAKGVKQKEARP
jgi:KaiC/GvpD/RAD55 family RecA-like ATPase